MDDIKVNNIIKDIFKANYSKINNVEVSNKTKNNNKLKIVKDIRINIIIGKFKIFILVIC